VTVTSVLIGAGDGSQLSDATATSRASPRLASDPTVKVVTGVPRRPHRAASAAAENATPLSAPSPTSRCPRTNRSPCHFSNVRFR
jgi:hypothetical protein